MHAQIYCSESLPWEPGKPMIHASTENPAPAQVTTRSEVAMKGASCECPRNWGRAFPELLLGGPEVSAVAEEWLACNSDNPGLGLQKRQPISLRLSRLITFWLHPEILKVLTPQLCNAKKFSTYPPHREAL